MHVIPINSMCSNIVDRFLFIIMIHVLIYIIGLNRSNTASNTYMGMKYTYI